MTPMRLVASREPFDDPDWLFEPKLDGFRALAYVASGACELVSRNGHTFHRWPLLSGELAGALRTSDAVIDGEIACCQPDGRTDFKALLYRQQSPSFAAFDLLWLDGEDWRPYPLLERKRRLVQLLTRTGVTVVEHVQEHGVALHRAACEHDLEGIVGKWAAGRYEPADGVTTWVKVKNPAYSQMPDRAEFFHDGGRPRRRPARAELVLTPASLGVRRRA